MRCSSAASRSLAQARDLGLRERLVREVGERRAAPERERLAQLARGALGLGVAGLADEALEACRVELVRLDLAARSRAGA